MRSAPSLSLDIAPSRIARICFGIVTCLALMSVWTAGIALPLQTVLTAVLLVLAGLGWRSLHAAKVQRAVLQSDGTWLLGMPQGEIAAQLVSSSLLGSLIGLRWRDMLSGRDIVVLLWPDSSAATVRRPLQVWLRSGRAHRPTSAQVDSTANPS